MKEHKPEILYSDPINEIMGKPPGKILKWGTTVMFLVFFLFIIFAWFIRYPDTIPAPVEITTTNPPVTLDTKITGHIKSLLVKNGDTVSTGQILSVMETTASMSEVELLKQTTDTITKPELLNAQNLPAFSDLGELQGFYASFLKSLSDLNNYTINDFYGSKIISVTDEINRIQEYINKLIVKEKLYNDNQKLETKKYKRVSSLFSDSLIAESELEKSHQSLILIDIELQQAQIEQSAKSIEMAERRQLLLDYKIKRHEEREKLILILGESFLNLKAQIGIWESSYLLISPIDGIASFTKFWSANQSVVKGEPVINVVPLDPGNFLGRINLKMQRSGKVYPKQPVNIKLSSYPYMQYGMVRGVVISKSLVPSGDAYIIEIDFPWGLTSLYGKELIFTQNMKGTAEIITEDVRLLQRIINPFRHLISKNKR